MSYERNNAIARRCAADKDHPARIIAHFLISGTGDHTHALEFASERELEAFEARNGHLELWEIYYERARYAAPRATEMDAKIVRYYDAWHALQRAHGAAEFAAARREYEAACTAAFGPRRHKAINRYN